MLFKEAITFWDFVSKAEEWGSDLLQLLWWFFVVLGFGFVLGFFVWLVCFVFGFVFFLKMHLKLQISGMSKLVESC